MVKDIIIREDVAPATLTVNPGDEIRWINKRQGDARVVFLDPVTEMLSCQRNFGGLMGGDRNQYTAKLSSNDSASSCFRRAGENQICRTGGLHPSKRRSQYSGNDHGRWSRHRGLDDQQRSDFDAGHLTGK